jgi:hypothetical protein
VGIQFLGLMEILLNLLKDPFLLSAPTITYDVKCHQTWHHVQPREAQLEMSVDFRSIRFEF